MRHTFATLALSAGADLYWLSKQLGHKDVRTTLKHYARFQRAVDERNLFLLDAFSRSAEDTLAISGHQRERSAWSPR
jgi:integrase